MAFGKTTLRLLKWMYWVVLLLAHIYIVYLMFVTDRAILAILWMIVGLIMIFVFYFYYFPWGDPGTIWPPYVTACPDYLTSIGNSRCVDYVGLHSSKIRKSDPTLTPPTSDSDPAVFVNSGTPAQKAANAAARDLSWQGVI